MEIRHYNSDVSAQLVNRFVENNLVFGTGAQYTSLVSPSCTCVSPDEAAEMKADLDAVWALYRTWNRLYLSSLSGVLPDWIRESTENELTWREIRAHRTVASAGVEPAMCRVDYVTLGRERKVAEVQWKSGGLGLFFGIQNVLGTVVPPTASAVPLGDLAENFCRLICSFSGHENPVAANLVTHQWYKSEHWLQALAGTKGIRYFPIHKIEAPARILERNGRFYVSEGGNLHRLDFLYGRQFADLFRDGMIRLISVVLEGRIWVETPPNHIYKQKWGLALPFMKEFRHLFGEETRRIIIPAALIRGPKPDLAGLVPYLENPHRERLLDVKTIEGLADLPASLRRMLVFKCGSGTGGYHSHGKGVLRIVGSRGSALRTLQFVKDRVITHREPWIVQQYVDKTYEISVSLPDALDDVRVLKAHARFMVFGGRGDGRNPVVMGGLGNYGSHWKVSGKSPAIGERGNLIGTAFNDIRVCRPA